MKYKTYGKGWHFESYKHSLAAKGIRSSFVELGKIRPEKMSLSEMSMEELARAAENKSLSKEQKEAILAELYLRSGSNSIFKSVMMGKPIVMKEDDVIKPMLSLSEEQEEAILGEQIALKEERAAKAAEVPEALPRKMRGAYDIEEDVDWMVQKEKKEKALVGLKQDYAERLNELREFQKRKPTFEEEDIPKRIKFDELERVQREIAKLDAEVNPSVVRYEQHAKRASKVMYPAEFKPTVKSYDESRLDQLKSLIQKKSEPVMAISSGTRKKSREFEEKLAGVEVEHSVKPW